MKDMRLLLTNDIRASLKKIGADVKEISVQISESQSYGDYSSSVPLRLSKTMGISALELASKIKENLPKNDYFSKIEVIPPGFINFFVAKTGLLDNLSEILEKGEDYGKSETNKGKKVVVEYSSPNIAKPFTVGHLRSTIIGDAVANLLKATGWEVHRDNHIGDWGTQFGKQIYAIKAWGDEDEIEKAANPVKELVALYVKFHEEAEKNPDLEDEARVWFKRLEDGDAEAKRLWQKCVEWSMKEFKRLYEMLNVSFETEYGESFFEDKMGEVIQELKEKKLLKKDKGAELVFFENDKLPPLMILKSDGATLYATRDLATDKFRLATYGGDVVIINEVGAEQSLYFRQLFEIEKMLSWVKDGQRIHVGHGLYRFKDQKMSTRKGNTIWLEDILNMAFEKAHQIAMEEGVDESGVGKTTTQKVAIGAMKWNDLKRNHIQDIVFDFDEILNMQGNSGPYVQYTYARAQSVLRNSQLTTHNSQLEQDLENEELEIIRMLGKFSEVVEEAGKSFSPNLLANYLFELSQKFNLFYQKHKIIGGDKEEFRLALTKAVGQVIKNGLYLLGIESPEKM